MKAKNFDETFDQGKDVSKLLDTAKAKRPHEQQKRVNIDFPVWVIAALDTEARRLGVTRQALVKVWIADRLQSLETKR